MLTRLMRPAHTVQYYRVRGYNPVTARCFWLLEADNRVSEQLDIVAGFFFMIGWICFSYFYEKTRELARFRHNHGRA